MIRSLLRPWASTATWWNLVLVITGMWAGLVVSTLVLAVAITVLSTAIVVPASAVLLWLLFVVGHRVADLERTRYLVYTGVPLVDPGPQPTGSNVWRRFLALLRSPGRWRELLYLLLRLPVSTMLIAAALAAWAMGLALTLLPFYVGSLPQRRADLYLAEVSPGLGAWLAALVGAAVVVLVAPWTSIALGKVDLAFGRALLAHGTTAEMQRQVVRLESSRVAAVDSAEAERRRIERDLHDGAQQRLIAAAMELGVARERLADQPEAGQLVANAHEEVKAALKELRDLVRGIHPVILEDRGLDAALSAVVARSPLPIELSVQCVPRPPAAVESGAYFIVCEALANVTRHAGATAVSVQLERTADALHIHVHDDGRGGADPTRGTGLVGLADRVDALGGTIQLSSPPGGPTDLEVDLPCAS